MMYNNISFNANLKRRSFLKMGSEKPNFEINPLDVNIAKIQYALLNRIEREVPENGDFMPVLEKYQSKDPTLDLSEVKVVCKYIKNKALKKDTRALEVICKDKTGCNKREKTLVQGTKKDILEYLKSSKYFNTCKEIANK